MLQELWPRQDSRQANQEPENYVIIELPGMIFVVGTSLELAAIHHLIQTETWKKSRLRPIDVLKSCGREVLQC
jgi:hypothetical protein